MTLEVHTFEKLFGFDTGKAWLALIDKGAGVALKAGVFDQDFLASVAFSVREHPWPWGQFWRRGLQIGAPQKPIFG